jgi:dipeptidyl aminopeptidase/acylaminoacyl peptidase
MRIARSAALAAVLVFAAQLSAADRKPLSVPDLLAVKRIGSPRISPDGKYIAYPVTTVDPEKNKTQTAVWGSTTDGLTPPVQITPKGVPARDPRWSPDGNYLLYESNGNLFVLPVSGAQQPTKVTRTLTGASNGIWAPDGKSIAYVSSVYPEFSEKPFAESEKLNKEKDEELAKGTVKAKVFTRIPYRRWDEYVGDKRRHLFVVPVDLSPERTEVPNARDVTPGDRDAFPTSSTFDGGDNFTFTPDGKHLVFTAPPAEKEAWSTNYDLCRVSVTNTSPKWEVLTADNKAADCGPKFSPDHKRLAWRAQKRPGYEADKWDLVVAACKPDGTLTAKPAALTATLDRSVNEFVWSDVSSLLFLADNAGRTLAFSCDVLKAPQPIPLTEDPGTYRGLTFTTKFGPEVARSGVLYASATTPPEVRIGGGPSALPSPRVVSRANDELLPTLALPKLETAEIPVEGGVRMQMWMARPPGFDPKKRWPVVYLVHGGPQSAWRDDWSFRWNPQVWAAQGYVVVMPNPRGSVGFGQKFTDEINGDWGGKCYRDLVAGVSFVEKLPYVDPKRLSAAGGSFGGYMMNWFAVNDVSAKFKCLVSHASVWDFASMWGTTDELWFDEWELAGAPWESPIKYAEFSPNSKAVNLSNNKTPMLVIQNELDYRCPIGQGQELFTALQRQGVPSRFVSFPDEGHWILKPKNVEYWHKEVFDWLKKYNPPGEPEAGKK